MRTTGMCACVTSVSLYLAVTFVSGCNNQANSITVTPSQALLLLGQTLQFSASSNGTPLTNPIWYVNGVAGGAVGTGTISSSGLYTAPSGSAPMQVQVSVQDAAQHKHSVPVSVSLYQPGHVPSGKVWSTSNPLVAFYSIILPQGTSAQVQFGTSTNYGLTTWTQQAPQAGGLVGIYVAGMHASSTYHMQALVEFPDGSRANDVDHTFTTRAVDANLLPQITAQQSGAGTPSPGVELLSVTQGKTQNRLCALATDLTGNVIWYYPLPEGTFPYPLKQLSNGHMMILTGGTVNDIREINLADNVITQVTADQVTAAVAAIPSLQNAIWGGFDHDVLPLPNGHLILLTTMFETIDNVTGIPDGTSVAGNVLIDWDPEQKAPVWTWSTFDHLDLMHAPYGVADWTHGNAVIYSPDDGDLIFSMRNQNWIVKINYDNGMGDGSILWRLGPGGDLSLANQGAPIEWNYGQHYPTIQSPNSSGIFSLMFFNNGNNRLVDSSSTVCGSPGVTACYSSVPIFEINEYTKTATVLWEDNLSPAYSICCGDTLVLANGNVEFDVAFDVNSPNVSYIQEVTQTQAPELIWQMNITGNLLYRGFRIPSLYPGVAWTQSALAAANAVPTER